MRYRERAGGRAQRMTALLWTLSVGVTVAACGSTTSNSPAPASSTATPTPTPSVPTPAPSTLVVTQYGAVGDGVTDNTSAFARAIAAAQTAGGRTVSVPAGKYMFSTTTGGSSTSILIQEGVPITLQGAGRDQTSLIETVPGKNLLSVFSDHTVVSDLTLDTQTLGGAAAIFVRANYVAQLRTRVLGGSHAFAIYYAGPAGAQPDSPSYNVGNTVDDLQLNDLVCNDGFSWSFQQSSAISNVVHTGSRLALYVDETTTVTNYQYTPGAQPCEARDGFWLTPPDDNITIVNFVSSGEGGKVGVTGPYDANRVADNVTIRGLRLTGSGDQVSIGEVRNLLLQGCNLGSNEIVVVALQVATGSVSGCTFSRIVRRSPAGAQVAITVGR